MLLVDDKNLSLSLDRAGYKSLGVHVYWSHGVDGFKSIMKEKSVDIVTLNFDFLGSHIHHICKTIRENKSWADVPIVITSVQSGSKNNVLASGADLFVQQPLPRHYFIEKIKNLLSQATRDNSRLSLDDLSEASVTVAEQTHLMTIKDISKSGILLASQNKFEIGQEFHIDITLPMFKKSIKLAGEVVRILDSDDSDELSKDLGVRFKGLTKENERKLAKFVDKYHAENEDVQMKYYL